MRTYCVLIDAGFLKKELGTQQRPTTFEDVDQFLTRLGQSDPLKQMVLHRVFFYDARPSTDKKTKPLNGGDVDFGSTDVATRNNELHQKLCKRPYVALRLGELVFRGWRLRNGCLPAKGDETKISESDLLPNLSQKGVDMRIGLDIAALALKRLVDVVVLVTGDTDFIPAMKFARREGLQLFLVSLGGKLHDALHEHSDLVIQIPRQARPPATISAP